MNASAVPAPRPASRGGRPTVLVTGASGVVGQGLLPRLGGADVLCLVHRTPVPGHRNVRGEVSAPRLGLDARAWRELARQVDVVVHAAALTQFSETDEQLAATNVEGVRHVLDLAAAAGAPVHHVSTAYLHARTDGERGRSAVRYAATKRAGEDLVRSSGLPHTIVRPSIVLGDSATGETSAFQGIYRVCEAMLRNRVPIVPFDASWPVDVVPRDTVADAVATLVLGGHTGGEYWLTSGRAAPTLATSVDVLMELADELGVDAHRPRFVAPETFDRLIAPVFLGALPPTMRRRVTGLLETFSSYLSHPEPLPSSLGEDGELARLGVAPLPDPVESLRRSVRWWAQETGLAAVPAEQVA